MFLKAATQGALRRGAQALASRNITLASTIALPIWTLRRTRLHDGTGCRHMASDVQRVNSSSAIAETGGGLGGTSGVSKRTDRKCTLVLEDGSVFSGQSFGVEVVNQACKSILALHGPLFRAAFSGAVRVAGDNARVT